jgi:hypothetical protein
VAPPPATAPAAASQQSRLWQAAQAIDESVVASSMSEFDKRQLAERGGSHRAAPAEPPPMQPLPTGNAPTERTQERTPAEPPAPEPPAPEPPAPEPPEGKKSRRQQRRERKKQPDDTEAWLSGLASDEPLSWESARGQGRTAPNDGLGLTEDLQDLGRHSSRNASRPARGSLFDDSADATWNSAPASTDNDDWWEAAPSRSSRSGRSGRGKSSPDWAVDPTDDRDTLPNDD